MELSGKRALVTGGAHRVGRALTLALAGEGCDLVLHYNSSVGPAEETAAEAEAVGVSVEIRQADLSDPQQIKDLFPPDRHPPVQLLVNSAAGFGQDRLTDVTLEAWERSIRLNVTAPAFVTQAFANALPKGTPGAVVNISDWRTNRPYRTGHFSYTVAKGALDTFTVVAASELAPDVRVNAVALGVTLPPAGADDGYAERLAAELPLQRVGGTEVVAEAVLHLLGNDFITGEIVRVDGGGHLV